MFPLFPSLQRAGCSTGGASGSALPGAGKDIPLSTKHPSLSTANATPRGKEAHGKASTKVKQTKRENLADTPPVHFVLGLIFIPR